MDNNINRTSKKDILTIVTICCIVLVHIAFAFLIISSIKYINLDISIFLCMFGIMVCSLIIVDILLFFSYKFKYKVLKIVSLSLSVILLIGGIIGSFLITRVNISVNKIVDSTDDSQYEVIRVVVATYDNNSISDIDDLNNKKIGSLNTTGISAASIGKQNLIDNGVSANFSEYNTTADLFTALVEGNVDAAIFPNVFKTQLSTDDETYDEFFEKTEIIYEYEEKVQTNDEELSKKDLSSEPFTVLLIGYAPEAGGGGLTDTVILASINPKTMSVAMTSIARDSYVPITCYGNNRSKINDAGAASTACLMDTVEQLMDVDIDFYMKINFQGVVDVVDAVGGIYCNSPVEFVGQSSSSTRGEYTVWVPKGEFLASGEQALAFARERHAMPGGDFDRQIHQQQVIEEIAHKIIDTKDVNKALKVLEVAGENFSTNMSISQMTSVLNYIFTAPNYSWQAQSQLIDIKMSRLTGYTYWFYSYSMRLPLWSYYLYDGSIKENVELSKETLGIYDEIHQWDRMDIFVNAPYIRNAIYHEYFDEPHVPENMPPMYPSLIGYTYADAVTWANENGVGINWISIDSSSPDYNESLAGTVVAQDPRKGALIEEYPYCTLTLMGPALSDEDRVPNFVGQSLTKAIQWCINNGIQYTITEVANSNMELSYQVITQSVKAGSDKRKVSVIDFTYYKKVLKQITQKMLNSLLGRSQSDVNAFCVNNGIINYGFVEDSQSYGYSCGTITRFSPQNGDTETPFTFYYAPHSYSIDSSQSIAPTCGAEGKEVYVCPCGATYTNIIPATGLHTWVWGECDLTSGTQNGTCSICGATTTQACGEQEPEQDPLTCFIVNDLIRVDALNKKPINKYFYIKKKES